MKEKAVKNKLQRYESYKDSGVEWLGEIPEHWELKRFKHIFKEKKITHNVELNCGSISFGKVVYKDDEKIPVSTKKSYQVLNKGEFLINPLNLNYDLKSLRIGLSDKDVVVSSGYIIVQNTTEISKNYYKWLLHIFDVAFMKTLGSGVRQTLSFTHIANSELVFPPLSEQTKIAQFLDDKTTKIEDAIAIKEQQINLLKERKQILIHKAVTRGLDDSVTLKDSGVEWIGEIPDHWEVCYFKRVLDSIKDGTHGTYQRVMEGRVLLSAKNVHSNEIKISGEESLISEKDYQEITKNGFPKKGDLLVTCVGTIGRAFVYDRDEPIAFQRSVAFLRINKSKAIPEFFKFYIESSLYQFALKQLTKTSAQGGVYMGDIMNSTIIFPPLSEQKEISEYIKTASQKIETAIVLKQQEIAKLKEYKSSLINGVVTGKVKVC